MAKSGVIVAVVGGIVVSLTLFSMFVLHDMNALEQAEGHLQSLQRQAEECTQRAGAREKQLSSTVESLKSKRADVCHKQSTALVQALQGEVEKLSRRLEATTAPGESSDSARDNPQGRWTDGKSSFDLPEHICDFERFNGPEWFKKQGCSGETCSGKMPTKPTVFTGMMDDWGGMQMNWTYEMMADMYGSVHIELFDEWEQAGGVLGYAVAGKSGGSAFQVRDVVRKFRDEHFMGEHEDFYCGAVDSKTNKDRNGSPPHGRVSVDCKMSLCCQMKGAGIIKVPKWLEGDSFPTGESFSFSPSGGGFAMHAHSAAWLGLVHGEKAWFVEDPTKIDPSRPYYDKVLPQILNARGFAKQVMQLPVAKRPWFCVQRKGDLLYLPDAWWHATLNRGDFSLAFGTKPTWFNTEFKKAGSVDARYNKGDVIASETVKKQSTALALKIEKATTVKDLSQLATLVIDATRQELSRERVSPNDRDRSRAGGNAVAAAATLCIAAKGLERRNIVRINTAPWQVKNEDEALLLDWLRNAKAYNKDSSACKEVLGAERWDKLTPAPV